MKKLLLIILTFLPVSMSSQEPTRQSDPCFDKAATQADMNACASEALKKANAELNLVYKQLLKKYAARKNFIMKLELAQQAWVKFRDAHMESLYSESEQDKLRAEGTVYPMCRAMEMARLTTERTKTLKNMLEPREGDVCAF